MGFDGFSRQAFAFFRQLARNNNREWFLAHRDLYEQACREPLKQLVAELGGNPARAKITRINRDMRFARGGGPYRTHIATGVRGCYLSLTADGLYIGSGIYKPERAALERLRNAVDADASGRVLQRMVAALRRKGYEVDTHDRLASTPRGYRADHPRAELLRMKDLFAGTTVRPAVAASPQRLLADLRRAVGDLRPLQEWLAQHVGGRQERGDASDRQVAGAARRI